MEARKHQSQEAKLETVPQPGQAPQPQPMIQFADEAWTARNAFKATLRNLERQEDLIQDIRLLQSPEKARFGR